MTAAIGDLITQATNGTRPVPTTLTAIKSIGASNISCGALTGWPTASAVHFIIYTIDTNGNKVVGTQTDWKGIVSGTSITGLVLKAGTDNGYSIGAVVEAAPTAAWADDLFSFGTQDHDTQGRHSKLTDTNGKKILGLNATASAVNNAALTSAATGSAVDYGVEGTDSNIGITITPKGTGGIILTKRADGWVTGLPTPNTITYNGGRNYSLLFNSTDLTGYISNGMRLRFTRTVTAPAQCTSLNGSTQFYSKSSPAGMTFTDDAAVGAWMKIPSYPASGVATVASRYNGTSGWSLDISTAGTIRFIGFNGGAGNFSQVTSYAAVPLNRWIFVAAQLDMSSFTTTPTTSYITFDGVDQAAAVARTGTNPTALIQAGNLEIGSQNGGTQLFAGKLAQVAIYGAKVTQATMLTYMSQGLSGSEASQISAYSFNNSINDLNANANNLTANGSAVATNADSPFAGGTNASTANAAGTTEFGEVFDVSFSTNTTVVVQVPDGYTIPTSGGIGALAYSTQFNPLAWPGLGKTIAMAIIQADASQTATSYTIVLGLTLTAYIPKGRRVKLVVMAENLRNQTASKNARLALYAGGTNTSISGATPVTATNSFETGNDGGAGINLEISWNPATYGSNLFSVATNTDSAGTLVLSASPGAPTYVALELD